MTPLEVIAALEKLLVAAGTLVEDPEFLAEFAAVVSAARALVPQSAVQNFVNGVKAKLGGLFKKK